MKTYKHMRMACMETTLTEDTKSIEIYRSIIPSLITSFLPRIHYNICLLFRDQVPVMYLGSTKSQPPLGRSKQNDSLFTLKVSMQEIWVERLIGSVKTRLSACHRQRRNHNATATSVHLIHAKNCSAALVESARLESIGLSR